MLIYNHSKGNKAKQKEEIKMTEQKINSLVAKGFKRWTKGNYDRLYINAKELGLECDYYKTGNIRWATLRGETISNSKARGILASKNFIDIATGEIHAEYGSVKDIIEEMIEEA